MPLISKLLILLISTVTITLTSCGDKADMSTPAQSSIDEYNAKLEECAEQKEEQNNNPNNNQDKESQTKKAFTINKASLSPFDIRDQDIVQGDKNAKVTVIEYFSPTCPHCAYYHKNTFPLLKQQYIDSGKITYITREFIGNKQDLDAAILARCSKDNESILKFINVILSQQDSWAANNKYREILTNIGQLGGTSPEKYASCLNDDQLTTFLISNTQLVAKLPKFVGTPAFFINGNYFTNPYTTEALSKSIDEALKNSSNPTENDK